MNKHKTFRKDVVGRSDNEGDYLHRWIFETRWFSVRLHRFGRSDPDCHHDHPWWFWSLILWRGYTEEWTHAFEIDGLPIETKWRRRRWPLSLAFCHATHRHRVILIDDKPAWTLILTGARKRSWGFWTRVGWLSWRRFDGSVHKCD